MSACVDCGGKGWRMVGLGGDSEQCDTCKGSGVTPIPEDRIDINVRIIPKLGYLVLQRAYEHNAYAKQIAFWFPDNCDDPKQMAKDSVGRFRHSNRHRHLTYAIAVVAMPPDEEWS